MDRNLPTDVQMQFMRPSQFEAAAKAFPVVYVPLGLIEWHGKHLPLGNDALKAHAILVKTAERFGGVVYPPIYFPYASYAKGDFSKSDLDTHVPMFTALFMRLKASGFRVIMGVSGHNVPEQNEMLNRALKSVTADGTIAGIGLQEITLSKCDESSSDHAAKWETSNMLFFYPEFVDMAALGTGELEFGPGKKDGIFGLDPREHASAEVGRRNVELASEAIGKKAQELLASLPEEHRAFGLPAVETKHWWYV